MSGQKKLSSCKKLNLLKRYLSRKASVSSICRKAQIPRKTFYQWLKKYKERPQLGYHALKVRRPKGSKHWRSTPKEYQKLILELVIQHPEFSVGKVVANLPKTPTEKPVVSHFGVQRFLERKQLNTSQKRKEFAQFRRFVKRLPAKNRLTAIERVLKGEQVIKICQEYCLSRKTFYKWLKRYLASAPEKIIENLIDQNPRGERHWKAISPDRKQKVIDLILSHPEFSIHKIFAVLPKVEGKPLVSYYGLQKILEREGLNTLEKRLEFVRRREAEIAPPFVPAPPPEIPLSRLRWILAPFATIPKWILKTPATWPIALPLLIFFVYILEFDKFFRPAMFFPTIALTFGLFFFLYSLKYYLSLVMVLTFPGQGEGDKNSRGSQPGRIGRFFSKIFGPTQSKILAMQENLDQVKLERYPFVSIHLPFYNEKRVAERILKACAALEYPNLPDGSPGYEVIVIDDSTDETTQIVQRFASDQRPETGDQKLPIVKVIHRDNREGFKGGALQKALEHTDPRAEYILVFDADFIPFPDTIEQFVKYFQIAQANSLQTTDYSKEKAVDSSQNAVSSRIAAEGTFSDTGSEKSGSEKSEKSRVAAVQGYQWHVLNKSENWITRGVRTEYAGSYVVERAGIELYGGLKMIAGSVFCIRADVLRQFGWGTSITEDFQLTLRLYEAGFKVAYTPYIQAPSECVSTVRRLVRQRMRWAEGHTFNVRKMWQRLITSRNLTSREKFEFLYLAPYYLQAAFFLIGTCAWFFSEIVVHARLPFWTAAFGWSLVFVNFLSLPLMNLVGLFLEESEERDYLGIASFILLSYIVVPFQAYAAVKALFEKEEGPWFRTPKTGIITDIIGRARFYRWFEKLRLWPGRPAVAQITDESALISAAPIGADISNNPRVALATAFNPLSGYKIRPKRIPIVARSVLCGLLIIALLINYLAFFPPPRDVQAVGTPKLEQQINIMDQEYYTNSSTAAPTDNSLGLIRWDSSKFSDLSNTNSYVKFEAVTYSVTATDRYWGQFNSSNYPVVAYRDLETKLRLVRCNDTNCAGSNEVISQVNFETGGSSKVGMKLDANQYPVIGYGDSSNNLKVAHCNDVNCAGSNENVNQVNSETIYSGGWVSVALDSFGYPVLAYTDSSNNLKVAHCNDVNCAGGNENVNQVNSETAANGWPFMLLDSSGYPVIVYVLSSTGALKVAHCNDVNCAGGNEPVSQVNSETSYAVYSMLLDSSGYPVIAYRESTANYLKVAHCVNANCSGTSNVNQVNSETGYTGIDIKLDSSGYPVIAYVSSDIGNPLKVAHCNDVNCAGSNENVNQVNSETGSALFLRLDSFGYPVIITGGNLRVAYCNDVNCAGSNEIINYILSTGGTVALYNSSGTQVATSAVTSSSGTYTRVRSNSIKSDGNFTTNTDFTVRAYIASNQRVYVKAARLIIYQEGTTDASITETETQVEVGDYQGSITATSYSNLTDVKIWCFSRGFLSNACGADSNAYNPTPTAYFEASLVNNTAGQTTYAQLYNKTDGETVTNGLAQVTGTSWTRNRNSNAIPVGTAAGNLKPGKEYVVQVKVSGGTGTIANAKVILDQSSGSGVSNLETYQQYVNSYDSYSTSTTYVRQYFDNQFNPVNFSGNQYFRNEATLKANQPKGCSSPTAYAQLYNVTDSDPIDTTTNSEVSTTATTATRVTSGTLNGNSDWPTVAKNFDTQIKVNDSACQVAIANSWLLVQISSLPVPEAVVFALPGMLFLPKVVSWWKQRGLKRKKKRIGADKPPRRLVPIVVEAIGNGQEAIGHYGSR